VVCDEGRKRARGLARSLFEGTRVGRAIGAVGGKGRLRAGESPPLQLRQRRTRSGGERHRARVRAPLTCQAARAGIEGGAPGRDPRAEFSSVAFDPGVTELAHVKPGMILNGVVTNVAAFGAFVDVGVHQDGLVHVSELANRFVKDPGEVVRVGDRVRVKVLSVDLQRRRIGLSLKALAAGSVG